VNVPSARGEGEKRKKKPTVFLQNEFETRLYREQKPLPNDGAKERKKEKKRNANARDNSEIKK